MIKEALNTLVRLSITQWAVENGCINGITAGLILLLSCLLACALVFAGFHRSILS